LSQRIGSLKFVLLVALGITATADGISASDLPVNFAGNLVGSVVDSLGTPQMGASVLLFDRYDRLVRQISTSGDGRFGFPGLPPSYYSIKISVPSLIPATRDKILVQAGLSSVLQIKLATIFSSVELEYTKPTLAMSEDWKSVLRGSTATRMIMRELPKTGVSRSAEGPQKAFTDTRGTVSLSAGDAGSLLSDVSLADFGTSFALATTLYGHNRLTLSGAFGQSIRSGMPSMGVRVTYSRTDMDGVANMPEVTFTSQQIVLPNRFINAIGPDGNPALRGAALSYYDNMDVLGVVRLEYGTSIDTVSYLGQVNRASPFVRATTALGEIGTLAVTFSSGGNPNELYIHQFGDDTDLAGTVSAFSTLPAFSLRDGRLQVQNTKNAEIGFSKSVGSRTYAASAFHETVNDGRLNLAGDLSGFDQTRLLPDVSTTTSIYNLGRYQRYGFVGTVDQKITDDLQITAAAGQIGGFTRGAGNSYGDIALNRGQHLIASIGVRTTIPVLKTRIIGNYEYVTDGAMLPRHIYSTQRLYAEPGLNVLIRQPVPSFFGMGKLELSADLRNLTAQGYIPMTGSDSRRVLLVQAPRAVRGGLNIIF
jgi:hypothetical protein